MGDSKKVIKIDEEDTLFAEHVEERVSEVLAAVKTDKKWTSKKKSPGGRVGSGGATGGKLKKPLNKLDKDGNS